MSLQIAPGAPIGKRGRRKKAANSKVFKKPMVFLKAAIFSFPFRAVHSLGVYV